MLPRGPVQITKRAVQDAKNGDHFARMYLSKVLGFDRIAVSLEAAPGTPMPTYDLDRLTHEELEMLDQLTAKMIEGPEE